MEVGDVVFIDDPGASAEVWAIWDDWRPRKNVGTLGYKDPILILGVGNDWMFGLTRHGVGWIRILHVFLFSGP